MLELFTNSSSEAVSEFAQAMSEKLDSKHQIKLKTSSILNAISEVNGLSKWHVMKDKLDSNPHNNLGGESNLLVPLMDAEAKTITRFFHSMLPSFKDDTMWSSRLKAVVSRLIKVLCYLRDRKKLELSVKVIIDYLALDDFAELAINPYLDRSERRPLSEYLKELPGSSSQRVIEGKFDPEAYEVHTYMTAALVEKLRLIEQSSGRLFWAALPESMVRYANTAFIVIGPIDPGKVIGERCDKVLVNAILENYKQGELGTDVFTKEPSCEFKCDLSDILGQGVVADIKCLRIRRDPRVALQSIREKG